jgi:hypothetical protein
VITTLLTALAGPIGTALTGLIGIGTVLYGIYQRRQAALASPEMVANQQAKTDLVLEQKAEAAIAKSDAGDASDEQRGDAQ